MCYTGATSKMWVATNFANDLKLQTEVKKFFKYKNYAEDIIQDVLLQILNTKPEKEEKLIDACINNKFDIWLFSILNNQKKNPNSYSNRFYVNTLPEQTEQLFEKTIQYSENDYTLKQDKEHRKYLVQLIKEELSNINKKSWYNSVVFEKYAELKEKYRLEGKKLTFEEFGKEMNIHRDSLWQVIKKVKIKLYNHIKNEL